MNLQYTYPVVCMLSKERKYSLGELYEGNNQSPEPGEINTSSVKIIEIFGKSEKIPIVNF